MYNEALLGWMMTLKRINLPIGIDDYKKMIDQDCVYIDKTLFIKEFWKDTSEAILITRPRRFGKTITLSMVKYFFELGIGSNSYLFDKSNIWQEEGFPELQGTYPVVYLSFKDVKKKTWESAYDKLKNLIAAEVNRVIKPIEDELSDYYKKTYVALVNKSANEAEFSDSLLFITAALETYYKKKVIVLIDEYDTPITNAYLNGYYNEMTDFIRDLFSAGLKSNSHLQRALLTGVLRTAKDGILSGLNNPLICTVLKDRFSDKFGFTESEVDTLLIKANLIEKKVEAKSSYNSYFIGSQHLSTPRSSLACSVYNPWSIINYIDNLGTFDLYWANTGSTELLERLISEANEETQEELRLLLSGEAIINKEIDEGVVFLDLDSGARDPWSFLLFAGYLTAKDHSFINNTHYYTLAVPNAEIAKLYERIVINTIANKFSSSKLNKLLDALISAEPLESNQLLQEFVGNMCSFYDLPRKDLERSLHLFVLGLLAFLSDRYIIKSNLESGQGRYDIMFYPKNPNDPGLLLEFKKGESKDLESLAEEALQQIQDNHYESLLREFGCKTSIICYGIAAFKKNLVLKMKILSGQ